MSFTFNINSIYMAGCALFLSALLYITRKLSLRRISNECKAVEPVSSEIIDDGFYCIMLDNGSCISGYRPKDKD